MLFFAVFASIAAHAGSPENAAYLKQLGVLFCTSVDTGNVDSDCVKAANAYLAKWAIPSKDIPDLLSYEAGFEANICLGPQMGDSDCFDAVQSYSRFDEIQSLWKGCPMDEKKDADGYAKCLGNALMSIHNGNSCSQKLVAGKKVLSDLDSRVAKTDALKGQLDAIVQAIAPQSNSAAVSENGAAVGNNTQYLMKIGTAICPTWSGYDSQSDCKKELNFYFLRYPVPSSSGSDLLSYESGFESYMCLQDEYADLKFVTSQHIWSAGASKCFQAAASQSQFPEIKSAVKSCLSDSVATQAKCEGDQLTALHQRSSAPPCEAQLTALRQQVVSLNARSSNSPGSKDLKPAIDQAIQTLSLAPSAAPAK